MHHYPVSLWPGAAVMIMLFGEVEETGLEPRAALAPAPV